MSIFSKVFKAVGKLAKGVSKVAGFVPGVGGAVGKIAGTVGNLLDHKAPMTKIYTPFNPQTARGNVTQAGSGWTPQVLRQTPILPGGAIATPSGIVAPSSSPPPTRYGGARKKTTTKRRRASTGTRSRSTSSRRGRKLKFGSPAWRKKYMKRKR